MELFDLLCSLRQELLEAIEQEDVEKLRALITTSFTLEDVSCKYGGTREIGKIFDDLGHVAGDASMGLVLKGEIPTVEAIKKACENEAV